MSVFAVIAALLVAAILVWLLAGFGASGSPTDNYNSVERVHMPTELATAKLVLSETRVYADAPVPLVARTDQVFMSLLGEAIVVETKTRFRAEVYPYDVIELSVQAYVLRRSNRPATRYGKVAMHGYVRVVAENRAPRYIRVDLLDEAAVAALYYRYVALHQLAEAPVAPRDCRVCRSCGHRDKCPAVGGASAT